MIPAMPPEVQMALGRLFRMMSRPSQPGDIEMFHKIVAIVTDEYEALHDGRPTYRPDYVAQRGMGARGDA